MEIEEWKATNSCLQKNEGKGKRKRTKKKKKEEKKRLMLQNLGGCFNHAAGFSFDWSESLDVEAAETSRGGGNYLKKATHLVVMVNGIIGSAEDWKFAAEKFVKRWPEHVIVHCSKCNTSIATFDGVDVMGERLADEVASIVKQSHNLQKISFVGHSLGGLIARYAIARLYEPNIKSSLPGLSQKAASDQHCGSPCRRYLNGGKIAGLTPMNFITVATPHLGSRGNNQLPFLCGITVLEKVAVRTAHWIVGQTGRHLFLSDGSDGKPPLLLRMVNCGNLHFMCALQSFKRRVTYANVRFDTMVGWRTSSIRRQDELPMPILSKHEKYPHITNVEVANRRRPKQIRGKRTELEDAMLQGLTRVSWERVDVSFHNSLQRFFAHDTIQVRKYKYHSHGEDVLWHMMDHFDL